jgi:hypothetical protein
MDYGHTKALLTTKEQRMADLDAIRQAGIRKLAAKVRSDQLGDKQA